MNVENMKFTPKAFLFSIRELGYTPQESIADIIDNSIAQDAKNIIFRIYSTSQSSAKYISIMDDGSGMTENELTNKAMSWGTDLKKMRNQNDLGKYGFGLKSASLAHCDILTVITKKDGKISHRRVDASHIFESDKLESLTEPATDMEEHINRLNKQQSGTVVVWQKLSRLLDAETISVRNSHVPIIAIREKTKKHIAMTYSEMMDKINIHINTVTDDTNIIEPWDPFLKNHPETIIFPETKIDYKGSMVIVKPYILPSKKILQNESRTLFNEAAGSTGNWLDRQGFYIYRKNRLIVPGDWLEVGNSPMERRDKYNQLRIKIEYNGEYDDDWRINLMKTRIRVPVLVRNKLTAIVKDLINELRKMNYKKTPITNKEGERTPWTYLDNYGSKSLKIDRNNPIIANLLNSNQETRKKFEEVLKLLEKKFPDQDISFKDQKSFGNFNEKISEKKINLETSIKLALEMHKEGYDNTEIIDKILNFNNMKEI